MPTYMFRESYTSDAWAVQIKNPQNRMEVARQIIEAQGGKLLSAYYAFGEDDVVLIAEFPDNVSAATVALTVAGGGAAKAFKTTVLLSVEEVLEALGRQERSYRFSRRRSYPACVPIQNQAISSSSRSPRARYPRVTRTE